MASVLLGEGLAGCDDLPLCQSDVFVAFTQTNITMDLDSFAPGVQTTLVVRSSLRPGDRVTLEVSDEAGTLLRSVTRVVDDAGRVEFAYVTVPAPRAVLRAIGHGTCGEGRDEITVDVPL